MNTFPEISFPKDFKWGISTSAYQIEGAWNEGGKSLSIWDDFVRQPNRVSDGSTGDVACDHYHNWKSDIDLMADLGIRIYRFSVSWSRILPDGDGEVNREGIEFYKNMVRYCLEKNIEPMLTMYHWDLPLALHQRGGVPHPDFPQWFLRYAEVLTEEFSPFVKKFVTINQPYSVYAAYAGDKRAPALGSESLAFQAANNLLYAHGLCCRMFRERFPEAEIGIVLNLIEMEPETSSPADEQASRFRDCIVNRMYLEPLLLGSFPEEVLAYTAKIMDNSWYQDAERTSIIHSKMDFIGINYYQRSFTRASSESQGIEIAPLNPALRYTDGHREIHPDSFVNQVCRIHQASPTLPIYITENGADYGGDTLHESERIENMQEVLAYTAKIMDNSWYQDGERTSIIHSEMDSIGINYYQRSFTRASGGSQGFEIAPHNPALHYTDGHREIHPDSFVNQVRRIHQASPTLPIYITENGADYRGDTLHDSERIEYLRLHILKLVEMLNEGIPVEGYLLWTLMDNFEWENGYEGKYGIFAVDEQCNRIAKDSALWYKAVISTNGQHLSQEL